VITSYPVVGRVVGRTHPEQTVIYTAHWDHLGIGEPDARGDRIYNGAVDNGTGLAMLLELARAFGHGARPARSVVFLAVTAEEKGLLGSEYYADHPLYPLATTVADINMDAMDPHGPARDFTTRGMDGGELLDMLVALGKQRGRRFTPDAHLEAGYFFRSDHFPFAKRGVPAVSFGSGDDWVDGGVAAGEAADRRYVREHYHQPSDEGQATWPFTGMVQDLALVYALGNTLANDRAWPNWGPQSEFRAARDASAAARK
jgi:Zn-dependent M28 family amino/carboxypeptidase